MKKKGGKHKQEMTLERLARMTADGFVSVKKELSEKIDGEVGGLRGEIGNLRKEMKVGFAEVDTRLNRVELLLIGAHDRRLDKLESDFQMIKTILEQKLEVTFRK